MDGKGDAHAHGKEDVRATFTFSESRTSASEPYLSCELILRFRSLADGIACADSTRLP